MKHIPVLLDEILTFVPSKTEGGCVLDVTAGAGGHFFSILKERPNWSGVCLDQDPLAQQRIASGAEQRQLQAQVKFFQQNFQNPPPVDLSFDFILADLGVSSFQLDDKQRGMSLHADVAPDFRMNHVGDFDFYAWVQEQSEKSLTQILEDLGEEPKARLLARKMKTWPKENFASAKKLADHIAEALHYPSPSRKHPATRAFQAFRMAINNELGVLNALLEWAPQRLAPAGRLAVITFHSLEDRIVKNRFRDLEADGAFDILTKKALLPSLDEVESNSRSRSSKLRVIEKRAL